MVEKKTFFFYLFIKFSFSFQLSKKIGNTNKNTTHGTKIKKKRNTNDRKIKLFVYFERINLLLLYFKR